VQHLVRLSAPVEQVLRVRLRRLLQASVERSAGQYPLPPEWPSVLVAPRHIHAAEVLWVRGLQPVVPLMTSVRTRASTQAGRGVSPATKTSVARREQRCCRKAARNS